MYKALPHLSTDYGYDYFTKQRIGGRAKGTTRFAQVQLAILKAHTKRAKSEYWLLKGISVSVKENSSSAGSLTLQSVCMAKGGVAVLRGTSPGTATRLYTLTTQCSAFPKAKKTEPLRL